MGQPGKPRIRFTANSMSAGVAGIMGKHGLHTVCQSAKCPNRAECWANGTATFMVLGEHCTRACRFCAVKTMARPAPPDPNEPAGLAAAASALGLRYAVITSVTRDDLPDGGAGHFAECVRSLKKANPKLLVETLIPDFNCDRGAIAELAGAGPDVIAHNLETTERLTPLVRDRRAGYRKSLDALRLIREAAGGEPETRNIKLKTGIMAGLGETADEVTKTMADARDAGADMFTIGQYLCPGTEPRHLPVKEYVAAEKFAEYRRIGYELGFSYVASGPLVRSSYRAAEAFSACTHHDF